MQDSLEDRIHRDGKHPEFRKAIEDFRSSNREGDAQQNLYDKLEQLGASPEEADEFVNMEVENSLD